MYKYLETIPADADAHEKNFLPLVNAILGST